MPANEGKKKKTDVSAAPNDDGISVAQSPRGRRPFFQTASITKSGAVFSGL